MLNVSWSVLSNAKISAAICPVIRPNGFSFLLLASKVEQLDNHFLGHHQQAGTDPEDGEDHSLGGAGIVFEALCSAVP